MKRPTRDDVAKLADVSGCTVSYVLNGRMDIAISKSTRERVLAAAAELGYRPNHAARALVTGSTHIISVWVGNLSPFYTLVINHLQKLVEESGYQILITGLKNASDIGTGSFGPIDGIIAIEYPEFANAFFNSHPKFRTPFVSLGAYHLNNIDYVGIDLYSGTKKAVEHLIDNKCKRIGYVGVHTLVTNDTRKDAYTDVVTSAGIAPEFVAVPCQTRAGARRLIKDYIADKGCPDGLFCHNDDQAIGVYRGLCDLGIRVPDDVMIIGCDGIDDTEYLDCPLSTIVQPVDQMCGIAWDYLQNRIKEPASPLQQIILQPSLEVRASSHPEYRSLLNSDL